MVDPSPSYSERMRQRFRHTGEGMPIVFKDGTWWSRGWKGCPDCERSVRTGVRLYPFRERYPDGTIKSGLRCYP